MVVQIAAVYPVNLAARMVIVDGAYRIMLVVSACTQIGIALPAVVVGVALVIMLKPAEFISTTGATQIPVAFAHHLNKRI